MKHTDPEAYGRKAAEHILLKFGALEEKYLKMMGNRIREIGRVSATDVYRLEQLRDIGADMRKLKRELARDVKKTLVEIETLFESAAKRAKAPYDGLMNAKDGNALAASMAAAQFLQTGGRMVNLSGTSAMSRKYQGLVDDAVFCLQAGVEDYQSAMRSALKKAAAGGIPESGIFMDENGTRRVIYDSMHTRRLDSAVRQNVIDGVKQLFAHMTEEVGKRIGSDGVEITAHMDCAEDHLPYQGRQYTNEDFQTLQDTLKRRIGQWNCRHFAYPIVMGASEPAYTQEELETYRQNSTEEIEIDGVCKSRYRWTQEQRRLETAIRREKDCAVLAKAAGDDVLRRECQRRINEYRKHYEQVSEQAGLDVRKDRMSVSGFSHVKTVKQLQETAQRKAVLQAKEAIRSGTISIKINHDKQARHMVGQKGYIEGRSAITLPLEELQALVEQYAGTGEVHVVKEKIWEEIDLCKTVGYTVSDNDGNVETTWVKIHYSKTGIHAVPLFGGNRK